MEKDVYGRLRPDADGDGERSYQGAEQCKSLNTESDKPSGGGADQGSDEANGQNGLDHPFGGGRTPMLISTKESAAMDKRGRSEKEGLNR